jgi:hypothetical protein
MTTSAELIGLSQQALLEARTDAGGRVHTPGDWATWDNEYPYIRIQLPLESRESQGRGQVEFFTTATLRIGAMVQRPAGLADQGDEDAEDLILRLKRQIERGLINYDAITERIQRWAAIRAKIEVTAEGKMHVGELTMEIDLEFYEGPEAFYQTPTVEISGFDVPQAHPATPTVA